MTGGHKIGFIDVGGGTRGIFGAGVLDFCMDNGIRSDLFIGVSAGSANGGSFLAGQRGRNLVFYDEYAFRKEYMGVSNLMKTGSYIGLDYIYSTLSMDEGEYPLDYVRFKDSESDFVAVATDAETGEPVYFGKESFSQDHYEPFCASCCVPVACRPYPYNGRLYFDGGVSDPIPYRKALAMGCDRLVVILTKPKTTFLKEDSNDRMVRLLKHKYPMAAEVLKKRSVVYNECLKDILSLEESGKALVVAPDDIGTLKTLTQDHTQLEKLYEMGYDAGHKIPLFFKNLKGEEQ